jgi:hypothetical protein
LLPLPSPPKLLPLKIQFGKSSEFGQVKLLAFLDLHCDDNINKQKSSV